MADRIIDDADVAVDELKRKSRRRLVGAIVLALAAAILIPLLLEKEPKKLGEDVAIQIPPVDDSKFVSRLIVDKTKDAKSDAKVVTPTAVADPSAKSDAGASPSAAPAVTTPPVKAPSAPPATAAAPPVSSATSSAPSPTPKSAATTKAADATSRATTPAAKASANPEAKAAARTETPSPAAPAPAVAEPLSAPPDAESVIVEGFVVQLAAFTDDKGANALANRLKKTGYPAYTEPVETNRGTLWRVRVGGYPSRADASAVRAKLKAEGHNGIVAAAK